MQWLRHALAVLEQVNLETTQLDVSALELNASHALGKMIKIVHGKPEPNCGTVRALLTTDDPQDREEALSLLNKLKQVRSKSPGGFIVDELTRPGARSEATGHAA